MINDSNNENIAIDYSITANGTYIFTKLKIVDCFGIERVISLENPISFTIDTTPDEIVVITGEYKDLNSYNTAYIKYSAYEDEGTHYIKIENADNRHTFIILNISHLQLK